MRKKNSCKNLNKVQQNNNKMINQMNNLLIINKVKAKGFRVKAKDHNKFLRNHYKLKVKEKIS